MKNIKKALIGTALAGTLVVGAGYGTYSWFTSQVTGQGTIDNGTLSLGEIGTLFNHKKFAPSQSVASQLKTINNTGTLDQVLKATYTHSISLPENAVNSNGSPEISKYKVYYLAIKYQGKAKNKIVIDTRDNLMKIIKENTPLELSKQTITDDQDYEVIQGQLSDQEVQSLMAANQGSSTEKSFTIGNGDKDPFWMITPKQHIDVQFFVLLANNAGNEFQNLHYDATFKVDAKQTDSGAKFQTDQAGN